MTVPDSSWGRTRLDVQRELDEMTRRAEAAEQAEQRAAALRGALLLHKERAAKMAELWKEGGDPEEKHEIFEDALDTERRAWLATDAALAASGGAAPAERAGEAE